jgi:hypothetical protein
VQRGRLGAFPFRDLPFAAIDDPNYVMIDLEFDSHDAADAMRRVLEALWGRVQQDGLIGAQQARIVEVVDAREY